MARTRLGEICKAAIARDQLEAVPDTRLCSEHARAVQKFGGEFIVSAEQERTSKPGSLKHNYRGVTTSETRNVKAIERLRDEFLRQ